MNVEEAFKLLSLASARDGRTVDLAVSTVWADDLADIPFMDAVEAVKAHYREKRDWVMPADVRAGVRRVREARERQERLHQPVIEKQPITLDKTAYDAQVAAAAAWFREHPGATVDDYEKEVKQ